MRCLQAAQSIVEQFFSSAIAECLIAIPIYFLTVLSHYKNILSSPSSLNLDKFHPSESVTEKASENVYRCSGYQDRCHASKGLVGLPNGQTFWMYPESS